MTEREMQLLLLLIKLDQQWESTLGIGIKDILSTDSRKILMKGVNMNKANLTMYSKSLYQKGCLIKNQDDGYEVNPLLIPQLTGDLVEYTFTFDVKDS